MTTSSVAGRLPAAVYWLALGAFAIGTEGFMIAPLLPGLAQDLAVSVVTAGQLVTVFALAYAFSSPVLTALSGTLSRRTLLLGSMIAFGLLNLLAVCAHGFWGLMGVRVLLAFAAGVYVPGANALAGAIVGPQMRGRAIAVVNAGITVAIALGVPLGAMAGHRLGWRMTFAGVAVLAGIAAVALAAGLPKDIGAGLTTASLRERLAVARRPVVLWSLLTTCLWATGAYTVYTYLAVYLSTVIGFSGGQIGAVMFLWGVGAAIGVITGGRASDRVGPVKVIFPAIVCSAAAFASLSISASYLSSSAATIPVLVAIGVWGVAHWAFYPAQQARLIDIAGVNVAAIVLSLNASFMYLGFSCGAAIGAMTLAHIGVGGLGWVACAFEVAAVMVALMARADQAVPLAAAAAT